MQQLRLRHVVTAAVLSSPLAFAQRVYHQSAYDVVSDRQFPTASDFLPYQTKYDRARGTGLHAQGAEIIVRNISTPACMTDVRATSQALKAASLDTGREVLGFWWFPRMPGFFWPSEIDSQPATWRAEALKSNGSRWLRTPQNYPSALGLSFSGEDLDITHREAVEKLLARLATAFDANGSASTSVGPLHGYYMVNEWKLTDGYQSIYGPDPRDHDVDSGDRVMGFGATHFSLMVDGDPYYNSLQPPRRATPLFSESASRSFTAYARSKGLSYTKLPADQREFNQDLSTVVLPAWVQFVPLSDTTYWRTWEDWVYETWDSFIEDVMRTVTLAQAGNADFRGCLYFQLPAWYSLRQSSLTPVTYQYHDAAGNLLAPVTERMADYAEYRQLNPVVFGTDMDYLLASPWLAGIVHETTNAIHPPGCSGSLSAVDDCVLTSDRFRHYYLAQGMLARRAALDRGKVFQAFARSQYFNPPIDCPGGCPVTPPEYQDGFVRTVRLLQPTTIAVIGPWYIDRARLPADIQYSFPTDNDGRFESTFESLLAQYRANAAFEFVEHPVPYRVVVAGQTFGFQVKTAKSTATPQYRWQTSTTSATAGFSDLVDGGGVSGATTASLSVANAQSARAGWYRVRVTNGANPSQVITSSPARLDVESSTVVAETGVAPLSRTPLTVTLQRNYANPVVVLQVVAGQDTVPSVARLTSVGASTFTFYVQDASTPDASRTDGEVHWIVVEAGQWRLSNGTLIEAGKLPTNATAGPALVSTWQPVTLPVAMPANPAVVAQVQTQNDARWVKPRIRNTTLASFEIALEQSDAVTTPHATETIGWIAMQPGSGTWSGRPFVAGTVASVTDAAQIVNFGGLNLGAAPLVFAALATRNDGDGALARVQAASGRFAQVRVQEDTTADLETVHGAETVAYVALGGAALLRGTNAPACSVPVITQNPTSVTVTTGATATFTAAASSPSGVNPQWQKDGFDIPGATNATLTLPNVQPSQAGAYRLRAWNGCGSAYSAAATLTVNAPAQAPFAGVVALPGRVEAENYDIGGEGVAFHDSDTGNLGGAYRAEAVDLFANTGGQFGIGWTEAGEWTEYTVSTASTTYDAYVRYATVAVDRRVALALDEVQLSSGVLMPDTGGWGEFQTAVIPAVSFGAGAQRVLRLTQTTGAVNIDWLRLAPAQPARTVLVADTFNGVANGGALNGRTTPTGALAWSSNTNTLFGATGNVTGTTGTNIIGTVACTPGTKPLAVEAQIAPQGAGWIAVGFANTPVQGWWSTSGQLWAYVNPAGQFSVQANGTAVPVTAGAVALPAEARFDANAYNHVRLVYTPATRVVELWVNGVNVLVPTVVPSGYVPNITRAGWSALGVTRDATRMDGFALSQRN